VEIIDGAIIKRNYELCVKVVNKSNIQSETLARVTIIYVTAYSAYQTVWCYTTKQIILRYKISLEHSTVETQTYISEL
jgi:hypothetical protein